MKGNKQIELKAQRYLYERAHLSGSCVVTTFDPFDLKQAFIDGAEWQYEQFEKERLKHCDELTAEQAQIESDFVVQHLKKYNRTPTFIDAIEYGRNIASEQAMKYLQEHHSPSEVSDFQAAMNIAVAKAIDSTINKSIEWLKGNIHYDDFGGNMEWYVPFADDDEMVENFKKFMED